MTLTLFNTIGKNGKKIIDLKMDENLSNVNTANPFIFVEKAEV